MLKFDPKERYSADECLKNPIFATELREEKEAKPDAVAK